MSQSREWVESPLAQGADEEIVYALDVSRWGDSPSDVVVTVYDQAGANVTSSVTSGVAAVAGSIIYLPTILDLTAGVEYRVVVEFAMGGHVLSSYGYIRAEAA